MGVLSGRWRNAASTVVGKFSPKQDSCCLVTRPGKVNSPNCSTLYLPFPQPHKATRNQQAGASLLKVTTLLIVEDLACMSIWHRKADVQQWNTFETSLFSLSMLTFCSFGSDFVCRLMCQSVFLNTKIMYFNLRCSCCARTTFSVQWRAWNYMHGHLLIRICTHHMYKT